MEKESIQGKAESKHWKRDATLKDLLNLLDEIDKCDKTLEEKAALRQRVIDYGQQLSEDIYHGKKQLDPSDDNETIKKFNIRMYSTYYTKGESRYEEAQRPTGYFDENRKFIKDPYETANPGTRNHVNPRWHPIPLREEPEVIVPPVVEPKHVTEHLGGENAGGVVVGPHGGGNAGETLAVKPQENVTKDDRGGVPPVMPDLQGGKTLNEDIISANNITNSDVSEKLASKSGRPNKDKDKKRRRVPLWLIPPVVAAGIGGIILGHKDKSKDEPGPGPMPEPVPEEVVPVPPTPEEKGFMKYTVENGQRMAAKQFGVSVEEGTEIYNQFVENVKQGKLPQVMVDLAEKYQMSKMIDEDLGLNLDRAEIMATSWLVMSESYEAITKVVHKAITNPEDEISLSDKARLEKSFSMAHSAAVKHEANEDSNQVVTVDYGLYGASKKTGWAVKFRDAEKQADKANYQKIVDKALQEGKDY